MGMAQEGQKCIFILYMEVPEKDMKVQEETVFNLIFSSMFPSHCILRPAFKK